MKYSFYLFLVFVFIGINSGAQNDTTINSMDTTHTDPEFKGGIQGLYSFIGKNFRYPEKSRRANHQGKVYVTITVEEDGTISEAIIEKGIDEDLDAETLRVVNAMPKWIPGKKGEKPIRCRYTFPIVCKLA